jgi:hypothetical protein
MAHSSCCRQFSGRQTAKSIEQSPALAFPFLTYFSGNGGTRFSKKCGKPRITRMTSPLETLKRGEELAGDASHRPRRDVKIHAPQSALWCRGKDAEDFYRGADEGNKGSFPSVKNEDLYFGARETPMTSKRGSLRNGSQSGCRRYSRPSCFRIPRTNVSRISECRGPGAVRPVA